MKDFDEGLVWQPADGTTPPVQAQSTPTEEPPVDDFDKDLVWQEKRDLGSFFDYTDIGGAVSSIPKTVAAAGAKAAIGTAQLPYDIGTLAAKGTEYVASKAGFPKVEEAAKSFGETTSGLSEDISKAFPSVTEGLSPEEEKAASIGAIAGGAYAGWSNAVGMLTKKAAKEGAEALAKGSTKEAIKAAEPIGLVKKTAVGALGGGIGEAVVAGSETDTEPLFGKTDNELINKRLLGPAESVAAGFVLGGAIEAAPKVLSMIVGKGRDATTKAFGKKVVDDTITEVTDFGAKVAGASDEDALRIATNATPELGGQSVDEATLGRIGSVYAGIVDRVAPLSKIEREVFDIPVSAGRDATPLSNTVAVNLGRQFTTPMMVLDQGIPKNLMDGGVDVMTKADVGLVGAEKLPSMTSSFEVIEKAGAKVEDALEYGMLKRIVEDYDNGKSIGLPFKYVQDKLAQYEAQPWAEVALDQFNQIFRGSRYDLYYSGNISKKSLDNLNNFYTNYFPAFRENQVQKAYGIGTKNMVSSKTGVMSATGGTEAYADPMSNYIQALMKSANDAHTNRIYNSMIALPEKLDDAAWSQIFVTPKSKYVSMATGKAIQPEVGQIAREVTEEALESPTVTAEGLWTFYKNGNKVTLQVKDPTFMRTVKSVPPLDTNAVENGLFHWKNFVRDNITLQVPFTVANTIRDSMFSSISSKTGLKPFVGTAKGLYNRFSQPEEWAKYLRDTGNNSFYGYVQGANTPEQMAEAVAKVRNIYVKDRSVAKQGFEAVKALRNGLEAFGKALEQAPRYQEWLQSAGLPATQRAMRAADLTVNFGQRGNYELIRRYDRISLFFNASIQGADKLSRLVYENPKEVMQKAITYITVPTLVAYANNIIHHKDDYFKIPEKDRHDNIIVYYGQGPKDFVKIPHDRVLGAAFGGMVTASLDDYFQKTGGAQTGQVFFRTLKSTFIPLNSGPPLLQSAYDIATNTGFGGIKIVPDSLRDAPKPEQYTANTSYTARAIGAELDQSPAQIEYAARSLLSNTLTQLTKFVTDPMVEGMLDMPSKPASTWAENPIVGRFLGGEGRDATSAAYAIIAEFDKPNKAYQMYTKNINSDDPQLRERANEYIDKHPELASLIPYVSHVKKGLKVYSDEIKSITGRTDLSPEEKQKSISEIKSDRDAVAEDFINTIKDTDEYRPYYANRYEGFGESALAQGLLGTNAERQNIKAKGIIPEALEELKEDKETPVLEELKPEAGRVEMNPTLASKLWGALYQGQSDPKKIRQFQENVSKFEGQSQTEDTVSKALDTAIPYLKTDPSIDKSKLKNLLYQIHLHESGGGKYNEQVGGGPAKGLFQVEPNTARDLLKRNGEYISVDNEREMGYTKEELLGMDRRTFELVLKDPIVNATLAGTKILAAGKAKGLLDQLQ